MLLVPQELILLSRATQYGTRAELGSGLHQPAQQTVVPDVLCSACAATSLGAATQYGNFATHCSARVPVICSMIDTAWRGCLLGFQPLSSAQKVQLADSTPCCAFVCHAVPCSFLSCCCWWPAGASACVQAATAWREIWRRGHGQASSRYCRRVGESVGAGAFEHRPSVLTESSVCCALFTQTAAVRLALSWCLFTRRPSCAAIMNHVCTLFCVQAAIPLPRLESVLGAQDAAWLHRLAQGKDGEDVKPRTLPKSISCGKTFRGQNVLTGLTAVHKWLLQLGEELQERIEADRQQHQRLPKLLTVSFDSAPLENGPSEAAAAAATVAGAAGAEGDSSRGSGSNSSGPSHGRLNAQNWRAGATNISRSCMLRHARADAVATDALGLVKKWARDRCALQSCGWVLFCNNIKQPMYSAESKQAGLSSNNQSCGCLVLLRSRGTGMAYGCVVFHLYTQVILQLWESIFVLAIPAMLCCAVLCCGAALQAKRLPYCHHVHISLQLQSCANRRVHTGAILHCPSSSSSPRSLSPGRSSSSTCRNGQQPAAAAAGHRGCCCDGRRRRQQCRAGRCCKAACGGWEAVAKQGRQSCAHRQAAG